MSEGLLVAKDRVITVRYAIRGADGTEVESNREGEPFVSLHGHGSLLPAIETALDGKASGERLNFTLTPDQAFGEHRSDFTQRISKKYLPNPNRLKPGEQTTLQTREGPRTVTVIKVGGKVVDIDLNHPLAGQTLEFDIELVSVREATAEELAHGHAHGPGGHHH